MNRCLLAFALLVSASLPVAAQTTAENFTMPCSRVVKLGLDKFMDEYSKQTKDYSTQGQKHGYELYAHCKRSENQTRAKSLSAARQQQLSSVRKNIAILENSSWALAQLESGGGTMWIQIAAGAMASREDFYGSFITTLGKPKRSATARRKANRLFSATRIRLRKWQKPEVSEYDGLSESELKQLYNKSWNSAHAALTSLLHLSPQLPDNAALALAEQMDHSTSNSLDPDEN